MAYSPWVCRELNTTLLLRAGFLYSFSERGLLFVVVHRLLIAAASLVAQLVKNPPAMQETQIQTLGQEDTLENEMETHSSILACRIPWPEEPGGLQYMGSQRVEHN